MPEKPEPPEQHLVPVTVRLFAADVEAIKRQATEAGFAEWQPLLRKIVHDGIRRKKVIR